MRTLTLLSAASAALLLTAGAAAAQSPSDPAPSTQVTKPSGPVNPNQKRSTFDQNDEMRTTEQQMKVEDGMPADQSMSPSTPMASDPAYSVAAASGEPALVTNGPVLDTAENRAKYPPRSRAGRQTAPRGN